MTVSETSAVDNGAPQSRDGSVGASLRALRQSRGWSLEEISSRIKFSTRQIDALENERWQDLPAGLPLRGMVRNYAQQVGADPQAIMTLLEPLAPPTGPASLAHSSLHGSDGRSAGADEERSSGSWGWLITIVIVLAIAVAYAFWQGWLPQHWLPSDWFSR